MDTEKATVKDYMTKNVYTVRYDTLNKDVIQLMKETKLTLMIYMTLLSEW